MAKTAGEKLVATAKNEWSDFKQSTLKFAPSYANTIPNIIRLCDLYWVDQYLGGDTDDTGWKRSFYNIIKNPTLVSGKQIDIDTKDIRIIAEVGQSYYPSWIFTRDLKVWMKQRKLGLLLNELVLNFPKYGSIIVKKAQGNNIFNTHLANIAWEPTQSKLERSQFVTGLNEMASHEFDKLDGTWDNINKAKKEAETWGDTKRIPVYDRFGKAAGFGDDNYQIFTEHGTVLYTTKFDSIDEIYRKLDWDTIRGRGIGRGVIEDLFENQISRNRIEEMKQSSMDWTSKMIFQTRDDTFARNLLTEVDNGEVLTVRDELTPVNNTEKNLAAYRDASDQLDRNTKERTFAYAEVSGERPPAGTPLGSTKATLAQSGSYYDQKREELGIFLKGIILDWVIPEFKNDRRVAHKVMLNEYSQDELTKLRGLVVASKANQRIFDRIKETGRIPDAETRALIMAAVKESVNKEKDMEVPARFYDNVEYKADVLITNEAIDVAAELTTLQTIATLISQNPQMMDDPRTKRLLDRMMDISGTNPLDVDPAEIPEPTDAVTSAVSRGSVARPNPIPSGQGQAIQTV